MRPSTQVSLAPLGPTARGRLWLAAIVALCLLVAGVLGVAPTAAAAAGVPAAPGDPAAQALADKYAPVVVVRLQQELCGAGPDRPVAVDAVLGNQDVELVGPDGRVVTTGPTAADLANLPAGYYLNYPGDPLAPKCDYSYWAAGMPAGPTVYARIVSEPAEPDKLTLQYWFFWIFNDWNDKHEGDWEMIQIQFPAATAAQALTVAPTEVAFAQHEGSEVSAWDDPKLHRDGDHVAVYPGQGSHAAYFTQSLWFGKSAAAGFGCDNTTTPGVEMRPEVVLIPPDPAADPAFAWLTFQGRWGEKAPSFNNGPTGPNTKDQWAEPVTWQATEGRPAAVAIPPVGGSALDAFCSLTGGGSLLFIKLLDRPWAVLALVAVVVGALVLLVRATRWRGARALPLAQQRRAGQIIAASFGVWRRFAGPMLLLGLGALVLFGIGVAARELIFGVAPESTDLAAVGAPTDARRQLLSVVVALVLQVLPVFVLVAAVQQLLAAAGGTRPSVGMPGAGSSVGAGSSPYPGGHAASGGRVDAGGRPTAGAALSATFRRPAALLVLIAYYFAGTLLALTIIGLPVALWLLSRWAAAAPAAAFEGLSVGAALKRSDGLTEGHRWRTLALTMCLLLLGTSVAGVVGALLLLLTSASFAVVNLVTGVVLMVLISVAAAGLALQYLDLRQRH